MNTHIKILVIHIQEVDTNKYLKYSNCCDVSDSMQLSSSQTQSGEIPLESWRILEGLDAIKVKNKKQIFFFALCKDKKNPNLGYVSRKQIF